MSHFLQKALELEQKNTPYVVVTMIAAKGHVPQDPGAKAIVTEEGLFSGTIGGGKVEAKAIRHAQEILRAAVQQPELHTWNLQSEVGMSCGGEGTYLFESFGLATWKIAVFGAGHIAQVFVPTLLNLPCQVVCLDTREEWLEKLPSQHNLKKILSKNLCEEVANLQGHDFTLMTQGHGTDLPILEKIFTHFPESRYIGVIGSDVKAMKIKNELRECGINEEFLNRLRCPMGLDIGSNHPGEIAISIAAELLQVRSKFI